MSDTPEDFRPFAHSRGDTAFERLKFRARLLADFQVRTVHAHVLTHLQGKTGTLLDVGCGDSPYREAVKSAGLKYMGVDTVDAERFGYRRDDITPYDGEHLPFTDASFEVLLCTEVLEHVRHPETLVGEMWRVMKPGATALITVPWSARVHYAPWDFHRFAPSALKELFQKFSSVEVVARGTDLTSISAKVLVACLRTLPQPGRPLTRWLKDVVAAIPLAPLAVPAVALGHASLLAELGSNDDPLGYSIFVTK
jgi:SAM-dependent methyltransferase